MKHPLWILNSALALLLIGACIFVLISRQKVPYRESVDPELSVDRIKQGEIKVNLKKIYENDLFGTYQKELKPIVEVAAPLPIPEPPVAEQPQVPEEFTPEFLDPLNITLKGIVVISGDEAKNRAIIQDNQTAQEQTYKVGDTFADAQLIRIFNNKIIFLRSNGQQEILYLRERDAELDPTYSSLSGWNSIVKKIDTNQYAINTKLFLERIQNIAQLIDALDLTTAFQQGRSIGCRIGTAPEGSLAKALGLMVGDIVTQVEGIPATDTENRFAIYKTILKKDDGQKISVDVLRQAKPIELVYSFQDFNITDTNAHELNPAQELAWQERMKEKQIRAMKQKHSFAPNIKDLRKRERQNMLSKGAMPSRYKSDQPAE